MKYLKDIKINLNNVFVIIGNFNVKDNDWDLSYPYYSTHTDILREVTDFFNLELSTSINQVPTRYADNPSEFNSVSNLMFL